MKTKQIYEFGAFRLDATERLLFQNGEPLPLPPKVIDTLLVLVENNGRLIAKEELMKRVWPDTFVEENNLNKNVSALRKALGERQDEQKFIETVPKRGYRFIANVRRAEGDETEIVIERTKTRLLVEEERETDAQGDREGEPLEITSLELEPTAYVEEALIVGARQKRAPWWKQRAGVLTLTALCCGLVAIIIASLLVWKKQNRKPAAIASVRTVAVLPFAPISADGRDEFLELGMADALITKLSNLKQVVVRPTSSVRKYAGLNQDPVEAGRELKVGAVLVGNVQKVGDTLRATVQLINVEDGAALWAEKFDTKFTDIFTVQDAISGKVVRALELKLSGEETERFARRSTEDSEAYQLYQKGRYFLGNRSEENYRRAIDYFKQAIERDPNYALAYVGLADAYSLLVRFSYASGKEEYPLAKAALAKAIELDETLAEAHNSLAILRFYNDWDWAGAEHSNRRALELNPNFAVAHLTYGFFLQAEGKFEEGLLEGKRAQELDPVSRQINSDLVIIYIGARQYDEAIRQARLALELDPQNYIARSSLGRAYLLKGMYRESVEVYEELYRISPGTKGGLAQAYALAGRRPEAQKLLDEMIERSSQNYVSFQELALVYTALGEKDKAFDALEKSFKERDYRLLFLKAEARLDPLRSDPRFADLERRVGLPQ
ncbi:MAG TPA: winged helix-turn-helix domain-containing protein [Pyrinomonadaceae bacterium]|nr:winged helix-turn-helix domain-containing protein [Pyrinomonadaceae bacterium]